MTNLPITDVKALSESICDFPIAGKLAYATKHNFLGRVVDGYSPLATDVFILETSAAEALCKVQTALNRQSLGLYFYDGYRPLQSVQDFGVWCNQPAESDHERACKQQYYPNLAKSELISTGYLGFPVSRHNFGHAADVGLIDITTQQLLDMGACFDYFDELSHTTTTAKQIGKTAWENRLVLSNAMQAEGFIPFSYEFWHFDYSVQAIKTPMSIPITADLAGIGASEAVSIE